MVYFGNMHPGSVLIDAKPIPGTDRVVLINSPGHGSREHTGQVAIATDRWFNTRNQKSYLFDPSDQAKAPKILFDRNYQDVYSDPGNLVTRRNEFGSNVIDVKKGNIYLVGRGYTKEGQFPFVDQLDPVSEKKTRLYTASYTDKKETIMDFDPKKNEMIVRLESPTEFPNYYTHGVKSDQLNQLTYFENPFKSLIYEWNILMYQLLLQVDSVR